jgi:hypothetical protein
MAEHTFLRSRAVAKLRAAMNYWLVTSSNSGAPHAAPVWGVWLGDAFWFGTMGQKAKNLAANPQAVVHLESGEDVVIVRGKVEVVTDRKALRPIAAAYKIKYVDGATGEPYDLLGSLDGMGASAHIYRLTPEVGWAWLEGDFEKSNTRWTFAAQSRRRR